MKFEILIEQLLPQSSIVIKMEEILREIGDAPIELEEQNVQVPPNPKIEIVARSFHTYTYDMGFGDHFRVLVAIGGVKYFQNGLMEALYCFATMYFHSTGELITVDFAYRMP